MKTESRREMLDWLNELEIANQQTIFPFKPLSRAVKLANAQEEIIQKQVEALRFTSGFIDGMGEGRIPLIDKAIALADAPYGGGE